MCECTCAAYSDRRGDDGSLGSYDLPITGCNDDTLPGRRGGHLHMASAPV